MKRTGTVELSTIDRILVNPDASTKAILSILKNISQSRLEICFGRQWFNEGDVIIWEATDDFSNY